MKNSVLIIGLDGVSWKLLKPWIKDGELPNLSKLIKKGTEGDLRTVIPPISSSAWTSLCTGKNPGKHGIHEYTTDLGQLLNSSSIKVDKIWQILSYHKKRCGVINVIMTYPPEKINGYMVTGILTPQDEKIYSYPPELMKTLKKYNYEVRIRYGKQRLLSNQQSITEEKFVFLEKLYDILDKRYNTLKKLMNEKWDFFILVFDQETSLLQHLFFDRKDIMLKFFKKLDFYINDLIKIYTLKNKFPYIFILSDHGFSDSPIRSVNMRAWMEKNKISKDNRTIIQKIIPKIYNKLNKMNLIEYMPITNKIKRTKDTFQSNLTKSSNVYYKYPGVFITKNKLKQKEYEKIRDNLIRKLKSLQDPMTNEKVFQMVEKREDIYSGKYTKLTPDIVALPKNKYHITFSYDSKIIFDDIKMHLKGKHFSDMEGLFLVQGNDVQFGTIKDVSILDIFPTVLHILDVPLPQDLDGKVLKNIFKNNSYLDNKKVVYSEEDTKILQEKNNIQNILQDIKL